MPHSIRTERLLLRPVQTRDSGPLAYELNDYEVVRNTGTWPYPVTPEYTHFRIKRAQGFLREEDVVFCVSHGRSLIGLAGAHRDRGGDYAVGYMFGRRWWGRGFATEALRAVCLHAFRRMGARRLFGEVFDDNPASVRVLEKCGFVQTGPANPVWSVARRKVDPGVRLDLIRERFIP